MERHEVLEMMVELKLHGMRAAYDEIVTDGINREWTAQRIIGALLQVETAERRARSIRYRLGIARFPLSKTLGEFTFAETPVNEALVRDLHEGGFLESIRNVVQGTPFKVSELVEAKERVVAGAAKMPVISRAFLIAVDRALG